MSQPEMGGAKDKAKPFYISKREVWEAYQRVKANQGAAGVDEQSIVDFEKRLKRNKTSTRSGIGCRRAATFLHRCGR
jgi:hypothetical protein